MKKSVRKEFDSQFQMKNKEVRLKMLGNRYKLSCKYS